VSIDKTIAYQNPVIEEGMYFFQIIAVESECIPDFSRPRFMIHLLGNGLDTGQYNVRLLAVLSEREEDTPYYQRFLKSFHLTEKLLPEAMNRLGKGYVYPQRQDDRTYSTIDFGSDRYLDRWTKIRLLRQHIGTMFGISSEPKSSSNVGPSFIY
jgi:hypothetical protein